MRIKSFEAANMTEAMQLVRQQLGGDAVILSNYTLNGKVFLTAGVDETQDFDFNKDNQIQPIDVKAHFNETALRDALEYHDVLEAVREKILANCREVGRNNPGMSERQVLEVALDRQYQFLPMLGTESKVKMFMGTPGSGKSTAIAKAATKAKLRGNKSVIVSTDNSKAGANQQLEAFAKILNVDFFFFKEARALYEFIRMPPYEYDYFFIDTPGINPFIDREVEKVAPFSESIKADKVLTMDAGRNVRDALESADIFAGLGATLLMPTRLDLTRRIGGVITVADYCKFSFCGASISSSIAAGLAQVDSKSLARLILA